LFGLYGKTLFNKRTRFHTRETIIHFGYEKMGNVAIACTDTSVAALKSGIVRFMNKVESASKKP
jgi:hypothetical protein